MIEPKHTTRRTGSRGPGQVVPFRPTKKASSPESLGLTFTWDALERQLADLAVTPTQRGLAPTLVSATRKLAGFKPPELVLREVLCIAAVLMDETFYPETDHPQSGEGEMT
jgi:hypothetical protein